MTASKTTRVLGRSAGVAVCLAVVGVSACGAGAVRPRFAPFRGAISDTVAIAPDSAIVLAASLLSSRGISLHHTRPIEGYLETHWFNVTTHERVSSRSTDRDARAIVRIWADAVSERTTLVIAEAAMSRMVDPSLPLRETEMLVPQDHPTRAMLAAVMEELGSGGDGGRESGR